MPPRSIDENGKPVLNIFLMSCSDIKGLIPKWIISYMAPRNPGWRTHQSNHSNVISQRRLPREFIAPHQGTALHRRAPHDLTRMDLT